MQPKLIKVEKTCDYCDQMFTFDVDGIGFELWRGGIAHIQDALPSLSVGYRELLISGCCDDCFSETFPDGDDYEDEEFYEAGFDYYVEGDY